jgi:hypothetical protein
MIVSTLSKVRSTLLSLLLCCGGMASTTGAANSAGAAVDAADIAPAASTAGAGSMNDDMAERPARKLKSVALSPLTFAAPPGASQQVIVTGTYRGGATRTPRSSGETFVSSNAAIATVSPAGVVTVVAGAPVGVVECGRLIRCAFITGIEQTGSIPTD